MLKLFEKTLSRSVVCRNFASSSTSSNGAIPDYAPSKSNGTINPVVYNRNPRNLEKLRIARKPKGYALDLPFREYWHKLVVSSTNRHVTAHIEHHSGKVVVSASTKEWAVRQHLVSTLDKVAVETVGRVLAQRCLECGLLEVHSNYHLDETKSEKIKLLLNALKDSGIALNEPDCYVPHAPFRRETREKPWKVTEDQL